MRKILFFFFLFASVNTAFAQSKWKDVVWKYRITVFPYGVSTLSGKSPSNFFAREYFHHLGTKVDEFVIFEFLYKPTKKSFVFIRPKQIQSLKSAAVLSEEKSASLARYAATKGEDYFLISGQLFDDPYGFGGSLGYGRSYALSRFSFEPFVALDLTVWRHYQVEVLIKETGKNFYLREYHWARQPATVGPMVGLKINVRLIGIWGLRIEPTYALMPVSIDYATFYQDSNGAQSTYHTNEKILLSKFSVNVGTYFNFRKFRKDR